MKVNSNEYQQAICAYLQSERTKKTEMSGYKVFMTKTDKMIREKKLNIITIFTYWYCIEFTDPVMFETLK